MDCTGMGVRTRTRAQVIRDLRACGWTIEVEPRRSTLYATSPDGHRGLFDLRDLLAEVTRVELVPRMDADGHSGQGVVMSGRRATPHELAISAAETAILAEYRDHCTHPDQDWCDCDWCRILRVPACPYTDADECAASRERSVAGVSNDIPACPIHGAYSEDAQ